MVFIHTHILIGRHINRTIDSTLPASIRLSGYLYGCTAPDVLPRYFNLPHCKEQSLDLVSSLVNKTLQTVPDSPQELQQFSFDLGVITHYICDYFCQAHHNPIYIKPLNHARYENSLARKFKHTDLRYLTTPMIITFKPADSAQLLIKYLENKYCSYLNHSPGMYLDICYSVQTSTTIVLSIVNNMITLASRAA